MWYVYKCIELHYSVVHCCLIALILYYQILSKIQYHIGLAMFGLEILSNTMVIRIISKYCISATLSNKYVGIEYIYVPYAPLTATGEDQPIIQRFSTTGVEEVTILKVCINCCFFDCLCSNVSACLMNKQKIVCSHHSPHKLLSLYGMISII